MNKKAKIHNITIIIIICIALAYTELSAQSKGFTDTVILKNGTILSGVKAVVTKDSLVVTTSEGETSVFTKKEVSEVKKGGGDNDNQPVKTETKLSKGEWSDYQGEMTLYEAKKKCSSLKMRLPTMAELKAAIAAGETESWKMHGRDFWSSTPSNEGVYTVNIAGGMTYDTLGSHKYLVRCIR